MLMHMLWAASALAQEQPFVPYSQKFGSMLDSLWSATHAPYRAKVNSGSNRFLLPSRNGRTFSTPGASAAPGFTFGILDVIDNAVALRDWSRMEMQYSHARQQTQDTLPKGSMLQAQAVFYKNTFIGFYPLGSTHMVENFDSLYIKQPITLYGTNYGLALELGYSCSSDGLICTPRTAHPSGQDVGMQSHFQMPSHLSEVNFVHNSYLRDRSFLHNREFEFSRYDIDTRDRPHWDSDVDLGIFNSSFDAWLASDRENP